MFKNTSLSFGIRQSFNPKLQQLQYSTIITVVKCITLRNKTELRPYRLKSINHNHCFKINHSAWQQDEALTLELQQLQRSNAHLLLLQLLLHGDRALLVFTALILEPDPDDSRAQTRHLHQLFLHERVGPRVGVVAGPQRVQLLLVEDGADAGGLAVRADLGGAAAASVPHRLRTRLRRVCNNNKEKL